MTKEFDDSQLFLLFLAEATLHGNVSWVEAEALNEIYVNVVIHQAGFREFDQSDPAFRAIDRHAISLMRKQLLVLHPELRADLDRLAGNGRGRG